MKNHKLLSMLAAAAVCSTSLSSVLPAQAIDNTDSSEDTAFTLYAEAGEAHPGDTAVPFHICIRNNPGFQASGIRVHYDPALTPVLDQSGIPKSEVGAACDELVSISASNKERCLIGFGTMADHNVAEYDDGIMMTYYFNVPEGTEPGSYQFEIESLQFANLLGEEEELNVMEHTFAINVTRADDVVPGTTTAVTTTRTPVTTTTAATTTATTTTVTGDRLPQTGGVVISADQITVNPGDQHVPFHVFVSNNSGFAATGLKMQYDGDVIPVVDTDGKPVIEMGDVGEKLVTSYSFNPDQKLIGLVTMASQNTTENGTLFTCYFDVPETAQAGEFPVTLTFTIFNNTNNQPVTYTIENGSIRIGGAPAGLKGDVNLDDDVDVSDAVLLARYLAEDSEATITPQGLLNADVNADSAQTPDDVMTILRFVAKLITGF